MSEDDRLFEEATDLIIRLQNDPTSEVALEMVRQWRGLSLAHEVAWTEAAEIYGLAGSALKRTRSTSKRGGPTRRSVILGFGAGAAALAVGREALPWAILHARADELTGTAEIRRFALPDGSQVTLGPDSAVALALSKTERRVELLAGMSYFSVAAHAAAPLEVIAGGTAARCLDGSFDLSIDGGYVSFGVDRGRIDIAVPESPVPLARRIGAGQWLSIEPETRVIEQRTRDVSEIAAWREGRIVSEYETVSAVVARIARWVPGAVIIADPAIGARRVNGVFDLAQPLNALEAVVHPFGGRIRQLSSRLTAITPF